MCWWFWAYFPLILYKVLCCFFFFFYKIYLSQSAAYHSVISISVSGTIWTEKGNPDALAKGHWVDTFKVRYWYEGPQAKKKKASKNNFHFYSSMSSLVSGSTQWDPKDGWEQKKKRKERHNTLRVHCVQEVASLVRQVRA